jgi:hypothetical protein
MGTYQDLRSELLKRLNCSRQALAQRVSKIRDKYGPMSFEDGTSIIAHNQGIDLSKYLDKDTVGRVRDILSRNTTNVVPLPRVKKQFDRTVHIKIGKEIPRVDVLLSTTLADDAGKMARIYPIYYVLENSLRVVIKRILEKKYGPNWWETRVPVDPKRRVADRKKEEDNKPWHGKRGQHEIFYSDFKDLKSIIRANARDFKPVFIDLEWITPKLSELEHPRNIVAHHNPMDSNDIKRIEVFFADWIKLLKEKKHLI